MEIKMIKVYPTEVEAVDAIGRKIFTMTMFDEHSATIGMNTVVSLDEYGADELYDGIKKAIALLRMEK
jgi:hypothetical protein